MADTVIPGTPNDNFHDCDLSCCAVKLGTGGDMPEENAPLPSLVDEMRRKEAEMLAAVEKGDTLLKAFQDMASDSALEKEQAAVSEADEGAAPMPAPAEELTVDVSLPKPLSDHRQFIDNPPDPLYRAIYFYLISFEVITVAQLTTLVRLSWKNENIGSGKMTEILTYLVRMHHIRQIDTPVSALTMCGHAKNQVAATMGKGPYTAGWAGYELFSPMVSEGAIRRALMRNDSLIQYFEMLKQGRLPHSPAVLRTLRTRIPDRTNTQSVPFWFMGMQYCHIAVPGMVLTPEHNWLFLPKGGLPELPPDADRLNCLTCFDGKYLCWEDGAWVDEMGREYIRQGRDSSLKEAARREAGKTEDCLIDVSLPQKSEEMARKALIRMHGDMVRCFVLACALNLQLVTTEQICRLAALFLSSQKVSKPGIQEMLKFMAVSGLARLTDRPVRALAVSGAARKKIVGLYPASRLDTVAFPDIFRPELESEKVTEEAALRCLRKTECLVRYFEGLQQSGTRQCRAVFSRHAGDPFSVNTEQLYGFAMGNVCPCRLALPDEKPMAGRTCLIVPESALPVSLEVPEGAACIAFFEGAFHRWEDGAWVREAGFEDEESASEGAEGAQAGSEPVSASDPGSPSEGMEASPEQETVFEDTETELSAAGPWPAAEEMAAAEAESRAEPVLESIAGVAARLAGSVTLPSDEDLHGLAVRLLDESPFSGQEADPDRASLSDADRAAACQARAAQALLLLRAACLEGRMPRCGSLLVRLALACGRVEDLEGSLSDADAAEAGPAGYAGCSLNSVFADAGDCQGLALAACMHALFTESEYRDYVLTGLADSWLSDF
ncbi:MAG: hypothetical protein Q4F72_10815, partial [Desulfovibrionaceae bacterium]|nr:hypothetical protein [Desulfovibrionaceae bacterium]